MMKKSTNQDRNYFEEKYKDILLNRNSVRPKKETRRIIGYYLALGIAWIVFSDRIAYEIFNEMTQLTAFNVGKGIFYVLFTGAVFYKIIYRSLEKFKDSVDFIFDSYDDLSTTHEELLSTEETLVEQYEALEESYEELKLSEQRQHLLMEGANDGIWQWDREKDTYLLSDKWKRIYKRDDLKDEMTRADWNNLIHPDDKEKASKTLERFLENPEGIYENVYRIQTGDGSYRQILSRGSALKDEEGTIIKMAGSHTDITDYLETERRLKEQEELSDRIIEESSIVIILLDVHANVEKFNSYAAALTGYSPEEVVGKNILNVLVPEQDRQTVKDYYFSFDPKDTYKSIEQKILTKEGASLDVLWTFSRLLDEKGAVKNLILTGKSSPY
ncbi:MAG TPA: hypothetical protein DHN33_06700 [Eubacteriaceae bacterium]|nr:hypothetical protein [Eubacteriaceae bacterium]